MFGGLGVYRDGLMFGLVADGAIYLKTDAASRPAFAEAGAAPFSFRAKGGMRRTSYFQLPDEALDDPDALRRWFSLGLEAAIRKAMTRSAKRGGEPYASSATSDAGCACEAGRTGLRRKAGT